MRAVVGEGGLLAAGEVDEGEPAGAAAGIGPGCDGALSKGRVARVQIPCDALCAPAVVDVSADGEPGPHPPELPAEGLAAAGAALVVLLVEVRPRGRVRDDDVRVERDVVPDAWEVVEGARVGGRVVAEGPEAVARRVGRAEDLEVRSWA